MGQAVHIQGDGGSKAPNYTPNVADVTDSKELKVIDSSVLAQLVLVLSQLQSTLFGNGKTTTNASTAVVIKSDTTIKGVTVKALTTNTGIVYVGDSSVSSANGFELQAGESVSIDINNTNKVYIDVSVNGEGVTYAYVV